LNFFDLILSSITIPDVSYVIDFLLTKDHDTEGSKLQWASKAAATQVRHRNKKKQAKISVL
jgi:hypothetical protein